MLRVLLCVLALAALASAVAADDLRECLSLVLLIIPLPLVLLLLLSLSLCVFALFF